MGSAGDRTPVIDVSGTPTVAFGASSAAWWAQWGMIAVEGTVFGLAIACYFYYRTRINEWPPGLLPPALALGTVNLGILLLSEIPNWLVRTRSERGDLSMMRIGLGIIVALGIVSIVIRYLEFPALNCSWESNAYGSIVWTLLGLHTFHLIAETGESIVLLVALFTGPLEGRRYNDVNVNTIYWDFVVVSWIVIYLVIYWCARWL